MTLSRSTPNVADRSRSAPFEGPSAANGLETLRGSLAVVSALDVIQLVCTNGQSWQIRVLEQQAEATVTVFDGQVVDAAWGTKGGETALVEIVGCQRGSFRLEPVREPVTRTIDGEWRVVLLRVVQTLDERRRWARAWPSFPPARSAGTGETARSGEHLIAERARPALDPGPASTVSGTAIDHPIDAAGLGEDPDGGQVPPTRPSGLGPHGPAGGAVVESPQIPPSRNGAAIYLVDLGFAALRAGELAEAKRHWSRALLLDPTNRTLQLNLRRLDAKCRGSLDDK